MAPKIAFKRNDPVDLMSVGVLVGRGLVCQTSAQELLHNKPMPKGCIGVAIHECLEEEVIIPHPPPHEDDITLLKQAVGYVIAWPMKNIALSKPIEAVTSTPTTPASKRGKVDSEHKMYTRRETKSVRQFEEDDDWEPTRKTAARSVKARKVRAVIKEPSTGSEIPRGRARATIQSSPLPPTSEVTKVGTTTSKSKLRIVVKPKEVPSTVLQVGEAVGASTNPIRGEAVGTSTKPIRGEGVATPSKIKKIETASTKQKRVEEVSTSSKNKSVDVPSTKTKTLVTSSKEVEPHLQNVASTTKQKSVTIESSKSIMVPPSTSSKVHGERVQREIEEEVDEENDDDQGVDMYTITPDTTLKWDLLEDTIRRLQVPKSSPAPYIPLCRLVHHPAIRPIQDRVEELSEEFRREGYVSDRPSFFCSLTATNLPLREVTDDDRSSWDSIWHAINEEFEREIEGSEWMDLSNKMLYVWDGNHRLICWMGEIKRAHVQNRKYHCRVKVTMLDVKEDNEAEIMSVVARLNRMNEKGYVQTSYIDTICIVRAMGMANKTTLLKHIEDVHPGWIEDELKREASRRGPKNRWFKVPPVILSQILHPAKYVKAQRSVMEKRSLMSEDEFQNAFRTAFYEADSKSRKATTHAAAIADPGLGETWFRKVLDIVWEKRPKWLNDERLYNLATSTLPNERKCAILDALTNHNEREVNALRIPKSDIGEYRAWLRREVIWHMIIDAGDEIVGVIEKLYAVNLPKNFSIETLEQKRLHYGMLYEELCDHMKGGLRKVKSKIQIVIELAAKRSVYRWIAAMKMLHQIPVVKEWQNPNDENTMYSDSQVKALWDQSTYALCPLFLDYPMDACPKNEKLIFAKASELRKARIAKEGRPKRDPKPPAIVEDIEEEEDQEPLDGKVASEFESDDDSDGPPSPTQPQVDPPRPSQLQTQASAAVGGSKEPKKSKTSTLETQAQGSTNPLSSQDRAKKGSKSEPLKKPTSDNHPSTTKGDTRASSSKGKGASKEVMPLDSQGTQQNLPIVATHRETLAIVGHGDTKKNCTTDHVEDMLINEEIDVHVDVVSIPLTDELLGSIDLLREDPLQVAHAVSSTQLTVPNERLIKMLETRVKAQGKTYFVNGHLSTIGCNVIFGMIPTGEEVYGIKDPGIPQWNNIQFGDLEHIFLMAKQVLDDVGLMVFVTSKHIVRHLGAICQSHGFKVHHVLTVACKPQISMFQGMRSNICEVCVIVREQRTGECPIPDTDLFFDDVDPKDWICGRDGLPLRGAMQRSKVFYKWLVETYSKMGDVLIQLYGEVGALASSAALSGRNIIVVESNEAIHGLILAT